MAAVAEGKITFTVGAVVRYIDKIGNVSQGSVDVSLGLPDFTKNNKEMLSMYKYMILTRTLDEKAVNLQKTGQLGTYPPRAREEAVSVGIGFALKSEDIFLPQYGEAGTYLVRGVQARDIFLFWGGDERGNASLGNNFPFCIPIGTHLPHAVGVAYALKLQGGSAGSNMLPGAVLAICGDGGTSKEDFYGAINFAGVWKVPVVFVIRNNQFAISVPLKQQTAAQTLAQKAIAAGILSLKRVDGDDIIAVRKVTEDALAWAREGNGPVVLEMLTYRLSPHTTADDPTKYRDNKETFEYQNGGPIDRFSRFLMERGLLSLSEDSRIKQSSKVRIEEEAQEYLSTPPPSPESMFEFLYERLPLSLQKQKESVVRLKEKTKEHKNGS